MHGVSSGSCNSLCVDDTSRGQPVIKAHLKCLIYILQLSKLACILQQNKVKREKKHQRGGIPSAIHSVLASDTRNNEKNKHQIISCGGQKRIVPYFLRTWNFLLLTGSRTQKKVSSETSRTAFPLWYFRNPHWLRHRTTVRPGGQNLHLHPFGPATLTSLLLHFATGLHSNSIPKQSLKLAVA